MALVARIRSTLARPGARRALTLALVVCNLLIVNFIASRRYLRGDLSRGAHFTLSPRTVEVLEELAVPVQVTVLWTLPAQFQESIHDDIKELLVQMRQRTARLSVTFVDVDADPERASWLAKQHGVNPIELRTGAVIVAARAQTRVIPFASLSIYAIDAAGNRTLRGFFGESTLLSSVLSVSRGQPTRLCVTTGHGEGDFGSYEPAGFGLLADELRRNSYELAPVPPSSLVAEPAGCDGLLIVGPQTQFAAPELTGMSRWLTRKGGRVLMLLGPVLDRQATRFLRIGLEDWLASLGAQPMDNIVIDPLTIPGEEPRMTWGTSSGYGRHPIAQALSGKLTIWPLTREIRPTQVSGHRKAQVLVTTSADGWGETDLGSLRGERPLTLSPQMDRRGPVPVALAMEHGQARLVVLGTERGVMNQRLAGRVVRDHNRDLLLAALGWLHDAPAIALPGPARPAHVHLSLTDRQLTLVFLICVVGLPLAAAAVALVVWHRRRKEPA